MIHLKRVTRLKQILGTIRIAWRKYGKRGRAVVRYEYRNWQRVLQYSAKHRWRVRRMKRQDVLSRIYREDAKADEDWTAIANKVPLDRPLPPHEATTRESLEREYLQTVLTPLQFYSVEVDIERQDEAGGLVKSTDNRYFQVLGAQTSQTRERTMHTVRSADDVTQQNGMLVQILWMDRWYAADHDDAVRVYAVDDPEWVHPQEIADFDNLQHRMTLYRQSVADNDHPACMIVSDPVVARPKYPLDDARAPTLAVAWYLRQHGGVPVNAICDHKEAWVAENPWNFDHRGGTRCKPYLQVLLKLAQCLPLSGGHVPSQQPMTYYRLLMRGIKTEPGLKHKHYALVHNRALKKEEGDILPLEDDDPPDDPNEFFAVPVGAHAKEPPRRRAGGLGHGRGGPRPKPVPAPPIVDGPHAEPVPEEDHDLFRRPAGAGGGTRKEASDRLWWLPSSNRRVQGFLPALWHVTWHAPLELASEVPGARWMLQEH